MFEGGSRPKTKPPRFATVGKLQRHAGRFYYMESIVSVNGGIRWSYYLSAGESVGVKSHSCSGTTLVFLIHL